MGTLRVKVLGPVQAVRDGAPIALGRPKQRLVLSMLAARAGATVGRDELMEAVWDDTPPRSASTNLRQYVHGLRKALGPDAVAGTGTPGYVLAIDPAHVDAHEFVAVARQGETALAAGAVPGARALLHHALGLWHGRAFEEFHAVPALAAEAVALDERRLVAIEHRIDTDLRCGQAAALVAELTALTREHPYRERFVGQLMLALYRSGRQADALATYQHSRTALLHDLGVEPDDEIRQLHAAILRRDPKLDPDHGRGGAGTPGPVVPAELPAAPASFTGRAVDLAWLDHTTLRKRATSDLTIAALVGAPGVGKSSLALHWGRTATPHFPDGQLFVNLRAFHVAPPLHPLEAVTRFLRALGIAPARIPPTLDEATALYRSVLAGRRLLIVLDNAASAEQVRPLLPGGGCVVVVTSRNRLDSLVAHDGAAQRTIEPLSTADAVELLRRIVGARRIAADTAAAAAMAEVCGHLPLALCLAAANLAQHPNRSVVAHLVSISSGNRLDALEVGDDPRSVRAAFDLSYAALPSPEQRTLRLLSLVPGRDFTGPALAALTGLTPDDADRCLDRLIAAHLVERRPDDRAALHDLTRQYGRARALEAAETSITGLLEHYLDMTVAAVRSLYPQVVRLPELETRPARDLTGPQAQDWLAVELPNLVAACVHAADHGPYPIAWQLADALRGYLAYQKNFVDWSTTTDAASRAAASAGDDTARAAAELSLAHWHASTSDFPTAARRFAAAHELCRRAGWREGQRAALGNAGVVYGMLGELDAAARFGRAVLHADPAPADDPTTSCPTREVGLGNLGLTMLWLGRLAAALALYTQALDIAKRRGPVGGTSALLCNLVEVLVLMGQHERALPLIDQIRHAAAAVGRVEAHVHAHIQLSIIRRHSGDASDALHHANEALTLIEPTADAAVTCLAHRAVAAAHHQLGQPERALAHCRTAYHLAATFRGAYFMTEALIDLAEAEHRVGYGEPKRTASRALKESRRRGYRALEGQTYAVLAEIHAAHPTVATEHAERARQVAQETGWLLPRTTPHGARRETLSNDNRITQP
jgi:DNA-binding SARP family transcriptional activator/tetratricopeptide (TPR) repeat protein